MQACAGTARITPAGSLGGASLRPGNSGSAELPSPRPEVTICSQVRRRSIAGRKERVLEHANADAGATPGASPNANPGADRGANRGANANPAPEPAHRLRGWRALAAYARFVRVAHTLFSLPLIIAGMLVAADGLHRAGAASRLPSLRAVLLVFVAAAGARTAALALNRIIDRRIDALNPRTAARELPSGRITTAQAWGVTAAGLVLYFAAAALLTRPGGRLTLMLSPIPLVVFTGYPFLKRFTPLCHLGVGLGLALSPLGGWVAVTQSFAGLSQVLPLALFGLLLGERLRYRLRHTGRGVRPRLRRPLPSRRPRPRRSLAHLLLAALRRGPVPARPLVDQRLVGAQPGVPRSGGGSCCGGSNASRA